VQSGETVLPDEDAVADMQDAGIDYLESRGYHRYEISNFALDGFECRHNLNYWENGEYAGLGVAAHSAVRLKEWTRYSIEETLKDYYRQIERGRRPVREVIRLYPADEMFECVMLGLRLTRRRRPDSRFSTASAGIWRTCIRKQCSGSETAAGW
jgi:oxygen-independent coproporphyrinogen-3 oxidase